MERFEEHRDIFVTASRLQRLALVPKISKCKKFPKLFTPEKSAGFDKWLSFSSYLLYKITLSLKYRKKEFLKSECPELNMFLGMV